MDLHGDDAQRSPARVSTYKIGISDSGQIARAPSWRRRERQRWPDWFYRWLGMGEIETRRSGVVLTDASSRWWRCSIRPTCGGILENMYKDTPRRSPDAQMQIVMPHESPPLPILFIFYGLYLMSPQHGSDVCQTICVSQIHNRCSLQQRACSGVGGTSESSSWSSDRVLFY
jgi:hypothetical protein